MFANILVLEVGWLENIVDGNIRDNGGQLWLRNKTSVLKLEGSWFDSPGLYVKVCYGKILKPQTAPDVLVDPLPPVYGCMYELL